MFSNGKKLQQAQKRQKKYEVYEWYSHSLPLPRTNYYTASWNQHSINHIAIESSLLLILFDYICIGCF